MAWRYEIRLAGSGGQGIILAGIILAEAAGIHDGKYVCQTQSYGPEARGGASKAEVIISDAEIDYPKAMRPDALLAMNQASLNIYLGDVKPGGLVMVDEAYVTESPGAAAIALPFTRLAREELGKVIAANIAALGALAVLSQAVSPQALEAAVLARAPSGTQELNRQALALGMAAARRYQETLLKSPPGATPPLADKEDSD
jgi:2-oxoglutarate ferredoxin oxidoreductase subunit gamma